MKYLPESSHLFTVESVLKEHEERMVEPSIVVDTNGDEVVSSIAARFCCYDKFERFDISLSQRVMMSLLSHELMKTIRIKYGHLSNFKNLPGQVLMMMALDVSNASASQEITTATKAFTSLTLDSYPGENIVDFATEAQRLIKIMQTGYALPYTLGSTLLAKVEKTSSTYFNQKIFATQSIVKEMERDIGPLRDPKSIESHTQYAKFGPIGLCALLQKEYGDLKQTNEWPALVTSLPQSNNASSTHNGGWNHRPSSILRNSTSSANTLSTDGSSTKSTSFAPGTDIDKHSTKQVDVDTKDTSMGSAAAPASVWKYIRPADLDQCVEINEKKYYFLCKMLLS